MPTAPTQSLLPYLRKLALAGESSAISDGQLLECFLAHREEAAFAALVRRHGNMVLGVCRRVLQNCHDAEDAFQATFLVLARKAATIMPRHLVGHWLYGVAYRTAKEARTRRFRRQRRERPMIDMPKSETHDGENLEELQQLLDRELSRLPDKYRAVIVLCDLGDRSRKEAARQLGCPEGTLSSRLARAREMLRKRLMRRGVSLGIASLVAALTNTAASAALPVELVSSTAKAATVFAIGQAAAAGVISAKVAAITEGVLKTMLLTKLKIATVVLLGVCTLGTGSGIIAYGSFIGERQEAKKQDDSKPADKDAKKPADDAEKIQGTWKIVGGLELTVNGKPVPPEKWEKKWIITADKIISLDKAEIEQEWRYKIDPTKNPKWIDLEEPTFSLGEATRGIYLLEGDTLTVSFGPIRPTELKEKSEFGRPLVLKRVAPELVPPSFPQPIGWVWFQRPELLRHMGASSHTGNIIKGLGSVGVSIMFDEDKDGALQFTMAHEMKVECRPVAFDAQRKRYELTGWGGGAGTVALGRFRLDPAVLPKDKVVHLGIEMLTSEGKKTRASRAVAEVKKSGLEVLPPLKFGQPFDFTLTTIDGKKLRTADFRGKVLLIDCWATWCSPCMAKMPKLKEVYQKLHKDGFEIIGVSFDNDLDTAKKSIASHGLPWAQVFVPTDPKTRELWQQAAGIESLPRVLLIDPEGILRSDSILIFDALDKHITQVLNQRAQKP